MDYKRNGFLKHCVLVHMILNVQWTLVFSAPVHTSCSNMDSAKQLTELLGAEANELLCHYKSFHGPSPDNDTDDILDYRIYRVNIYEKLQDIYIQNLLFNLHIAKVKEYQEELTGNPEPLSRLLLFIKERLSMLLNKINNILTNIYPEIPLPPTPATLHFPKTHSYAKKEYGWNVINTLYKWHTHVLQVLEETQDLCDQKVAGIQQV